MIRKEDVVYETMRGKGKGGQHKNKTDSCVRAKHVPTGITVRIDGRDQSKNKALAFKELNKRVDDAAEKVKAAKKKAGRDARIHDQTVVRTYDYSRGIVKDHRTGKQARIKEVMGKGRLDLLK